MRVSIVIPNWNGAEKLKKNLPAVLEAAKYSKVGEVIVVDDGSTDESLKVLSKYSEVKVIKKEKNTGFSSTVNLGVQNTNCDLIVLLNTDVIPEKEFIEKALVHFKNEKVFSVSCNAGGGWSTAKFEDGYFWHGQAENSMDKSKPHHTLWTSGGSGIFRKKIWESLGGFDTLFDPFYEEDVDLGYRATKRGFINIWEPESKVEHYKEPGVISTNFSKKVISQIAQRNQLIFIWKNITDSEYTHQHKKALAKMLFSHPKYGLVFISALLRLRRILERRGIEETESKLTDKQVLAMVGG